MIDAAEHEQATSWIGAYGADLADALEKRIAARASTGAIVKAGNRAMGVGASNEEIAAAHYAARIREDPVTALRREVFKEHFREAFKEHCREAAVADNGTCAVAHQSEAIAGSRQCGADAPNVVPSRCGLAEVMRLRMLAALASYEAHCNELAPHELMQTLECYRVHAPSLFAPPGGGPWDGASMQELLGLAWRDIEPCSGTPRSAYQIEPRPVPEKRVAPEAEPASRACRPRLDAHEPDL